MFKKIIAVSNPETKEARVLVGRRLATEAMELATLVVKFQRDKSDAAREFGEGWGYNNAAQTGQKLNSYEIAINDITKALDADAGIFVALGVIEREVARDINHLIWEIREMEDNRWAQKHQKEGYPYTYPMLNGMICRLLWEMPKAVYNRVYTMIVSPEEQAADNQIRLDKMKAYRDQEEQISNRRWELRRMNDADLVTLAKGYKENTNRVNIPNPRYQKDSNYLTPGSTDNLVNAVIKVEFPSNLLLRKSEGYDEWLRNERD